MPRSPFEVMLPVCAASASAAWYRRYQAPAQKPDPERQTATVPRSDEGPRSPCPGCGLRLPETDGPQHPYMVASPACWAAFGALLAVQYGDPERMRFQQLVVDAYAVQHPGDPTDARAVQSVGIHLMTLQLFLEHDVDPALGATLHRRMVERPVFAPLTPAPSFHGARTVVDMPLDGPAATARQAAYAWAGDAWRAWSAHHETVRAWTARSGMAPTA